MTRGCAKPNIQTRRQMLVSENVDSPLKTVVNQRRLSMTKAKIVRESRNL